MTLHQLQLRLSQNLQALRRRKVHGLYQAKSLFLLKIDIDHRNMQKLEKE